MKIRKELIDALIDIAKNNHPFEFFALLTGKKDVIEEFLYLPFQGGESFALFSPDLLPIGMRILGTVHSHPSRNPYPSQEDIRTFQSYGKLHIIIHYPYCNKCWKAFNSRGEEVEVVVF